MSKEIDNALAQIARNYFEVYDLHDMKTHEIKIGSRVLRAALVSAYEAGQKENMDYYFDGLFEGMFSKQAKRRKR